MLELFNPKSVFIYGMGQESWLSHIMHLELGSDAVQTIEMKKLQKLCEDQGRGYEALYGLKDIDL